MNDIDGPDDYRLTRHDGETTFATREVLVVVEWPSADRPSYRLVQTFWRWLERDANEMRAFAIRRQR